ncbi:MAG: glucose/sorbosone dehydrogenase [Candidatus Nomurabacteria bacterium]|nr:glucose/sorbosone dehydrogenase [Candidatus Nomurabacteria bacterium]
MKKTLFVFLGILIIIALFYFLKTPTKEILIGNNSTIKLNIVPPLELAPYPVTLANGIAFNLNIPKGYKLFPAAEGFKKIRFMSLSPDGRLFLTDTYDPNDNTKGKVYILSDFDTTTHKYKTISTYLSDLRNPNSAAFYKDKNGDTWFYLALTDKLIRYKYTEGEMAPTAEPETLATFPDYGLDYKSGGWHLTRTIAIHNDKIYVSVGSSCNACEEKENEIRASIVEMNPDGTNQILYAAGLRNAVGIKWVGDALFATEMGPDHLGDTIPADKMYKIEESKNYGWPYCYEDNSGVRPDTTQKWKKSFDCSTVPLSFAKFLAHSAPLGFEYFDSDSPSELQNSFLVALHGSGETRIDHGYSIVQVGQNGVAQNFINGFLQNGKRVARPVDIFQKDKNSFLFSDDFGGVLYYIEK